MACQLTRIGQRRLGRPVAVRIVGRHRNHFECRTLEIDAQDVDCQRLGQVAMLRPDGQRQSQLPVGPRRQRQPHGCDGGGRHRSRQASRLRLIRHDDGRQRDQHRGHELNPDRDSHPGILDCILCKSRLHFHIPILVSIGLRPPSPTCHRQHCGGSGGFPGGRRAGRSRRTAR